MRCGGYGSGGPEEVGCASRGRYSGEDGVIGRETRLYSCSALAVCGQSSGRVASLSRGQPVCVGIQFVVCEVRVIQQCVVNAKGTIFREGNRPRTKVRGRCSFYCTDIIEGQ